jgi:hypothetical protein
MSKLNTDPQPRGSSFRQRMAGMALEFRVGHDDHQRVRGQEGDDLARVFNVPCHAQRQRFDALQDQPGGVRAHAGAEVAQTFAPRAQQEGAYRGLF